jgi:hypothetical protein
MEQLNGHTSAYEEWYDRRSIAQQQLISLMREFRRHTLERHPETSYHYKVEVTVNQVASATGEPALTWLCRTCQYTFSFARRLEADIRAAERALRNIRHRLGLPPHHEAPFELFTDFREYPFPSIGDEETIYLLRTMTHREPSPGVEPAPASPSNDTTDPVANGHDLDPIFGSI